MIKIQVFIETGLLREHEFDASEREIFIGRRHSHHVHLDGSTVSGDHARLMLGSAVVLEDLKSTNGTLLNGAPITRPTPLNPGDTVQIAHFRLRIRDERRLSPSDADTVIIEPRTIPLQGGNLERTGFFSYADYRKQVEEKEEQETETP